MPRAKVHPDARRRVVQACRQCKSSKRKCNASLPCSHCIKRGTADECDYSDVSNGRDQSKSASSTVGRRHSNSVTSEQRSTEGSVSNCRPTHATTSGISPRDIHINVIPGNHENVPVPSPDTTRARMLSNNEGQYVYVGRSASLSFLQLVRETVTRCIGPSEFSEDVSRDHMLEIDLDSGVDTKEEIQLHPLRKEHYVGYFFLATTGLIDILTPTEARNLLDQTCGDNAYLAAVRLLVIAIGSQAGPKVNANGDDTEKRAFAQARSLVFTNMLENPSLDMIRAFLLLSFYLLGACRRNAAFLYLGIAARAAYTLGYHTAESYTVLDETRRHAQLRCWKSLVSLDIMTCSVLGRTTAILAQRSNADTVVRITDNISDCPSMELESVYRLSLLIDSISSQYNGQEPITAEMAHSHLQSLSNWSSILPAKLRPSTIPEDRSSQTRQALLGCMHISCFYYFAVMLVTRPFLIIQVTKKLFQKREHVYQASVTDPTDVEELSSACLNAAVYMAQTCSDLHEVDLLADNMCLLKAWIFAAGLVLGLELFAGSNLVKGAEQAFGSCRRVLQKLATKSPQAQQYVENFALLSAAIDKHKQIQKTRRPQKSGPLVARIMNLHSVNEPPPPQAANLSNTGQLQSQASDPIQMSFIGNNMTDTVPFFHDDTVDFTGDLGEFAIPTPESFMYDLQSFGMMPWGMS